MNRYFAHLSLFALVLAGCGQNPLGSSTNQTMPVLGFAAVSEVDDPVQPGLLYSPTWVSGTAGTRVLLFAASGGNVSFSSGGVSNLYAGPSLPGSPNGTWGHGAAPLVLGPSSWLCPSMNCSGTPNYRGVGGAKGDFASDFFLRYQGHKGPDPSLDYSSVQMKFSTAGASEFDVRGFRGIVFWARGHGNFSVNLVARKPNDFISPAYPTPPLGVPPYSDWNFYMRRFGSELNGDEQWKEIVVYFDDMVQDYGLAVDIEKVKKAATGLQFDQQAPYTADFRLDLDYVRLFR